MSETRGYPCRPVPIQPMAPRIYRFLPLLCGKHVAYYPADLVREAQRGRYYWFMTSCECDLAYLIPTESDGAHVRAADAPKLIIDRYEAVDGAEFETRGSAGTFTVKVAQTSRTRATST